MTNVSRPVAEGLFTSGPDPRLLAARRLSDGKVVFPPPQGKAADGFEVFELEREGRVWSYTVQRFAPKPPYAGRGGEGSDEPFRPYAVGYVEIPGQVIVESYILTPDFSTLKVGQCVRMTTYPIRSDPDGEELLTYAFEVTPSVAHHHLPEIVP
jgi:uncharacterized OB-fold protein